MSSHADNAFFDNRRSSDEAAVRNQAVANSAGTHASRWQKSRASKDGGSAIGELERRIRIGQSKVCIVEGFDRSDVFPIAIEQMRLHVMIFDRERKDVFAEVFVIR